MEPIQDDIETTDVDTIREVLNWVAASNPLTGSVALHNARLGRAALDRLVAERDEWKRLWEKAGASVLELQAERDRLIRGIGALVERWRERYGFQDPYAEELEALTTEEQG